MIQKSGCRITVTAPNGLGDEIIITRYPGGLIGLRRSPRGREIRLDMPQLYALALTYQKEISTQRLQRRGTRVRA
jgi:hypothetical protein